MFIYTQVLVHITETIHRWQFVKKSNTVATPKFSRAPNHKHKRKEQTEI